MGTLDFDGLNNQLIHRIRTLLPEWLPGGRVKGNEYLCGDLSGRPGQSCKINLDTGKWADFAGNDSQRGGDLISLYAAITGCSQKDAFIKLSDQYDAPVNHVPQSQPAKITPKTVKLVPPPSGTPLPPWGNKPKYTWRYKNPKGETLFLITRTDGNDKKFFCPWSFTTDGEWVKKHWPSPRPLYQLDKLTANPSKPVLIVEGEKAADVAQQIVGDTYVVTTWVGGSNSCGRNDWKPLRGRKILIWPDADEPGIKASEEIASILYPMCPEIKIINVSDLKPDGWDAADSGFTFKTFVQWAKPRAQLRKPPPVKREPDIQPVPLPESQEIPQSRVIIADSESLPQNHDPSKVALWQKLGLAVNPNNFTPFYNLDNIVRILTRYKPLKNIVWYDEFHFKYYTKWRSETVREWTDQDDYEMAIYIQGKIGLHRITDDMVRKAVLTYANRNKRNEIKEWLSEQEWDQTPRLENFFHEYFGATSSDYTQAVSKNFWVSMVARVFKPGCKVDNMVILEGPQGKFKSTALSVIGGRWYVESNEPLGSKDFYQVFQGKLIVEMGELDSFNKVEITTIKKVVSTSTDRFRPPYGRAPKDFKRQCVFVGTTNESNYLRDHTGGRRFWPITIKDIHITKLSEDREQLFAEAVHLYKSGENWHEVPESAKIEQENRRHVDAWEDDVKGYLTGREFVRTVEVASALSIEIDKVTPIVSNRIVRILRALGCTSGKKRVGHDMTVKSGWFTDQSESWQRVSKSQESARNKSIPNLTPQ